MIPGQFFVRQTRKIDVKKFYKVCSTYSMELATEAETKRFLSGLFYAWGERILRSINKHYALNTEQQEALELILLKPNNWQLVIKPPLTPM